MEMCRRPGTPRTLSLNSNRESETANVMNEKHFRLRVFLEQTELMEEHQHSLVFYLCVGGEPPPIATNRTRIHVHAFVDIADPVMPSIILSVEACDQIMEWIQEKRGKKVMGTTSAMRGSKVRLPCRALHTHTHM